MTCMSWYTVEFIDGSKKVIEEGKYWGLIGTGVVKSATFHSHDLIMTDEDYRRMYEAFSKCHNRNDTDKQSTL